MIGRAVAVLVALASLPDAGVVAVEPADADDAAAAEPADAGVPRAEPVVSPVTPAEPVALAATPNRIVKSLPLGRGLPVMVRVGMFFADIAAVNEGEGTFTATVDLRLRWEDPRLAFPAVEAPGGFLDLRGPAAEERLATIWVPELLLSNLVGEPTERRRGVRLFPDGHVELMERTTGQFAMSFDVTNFPFDRQELIVQVSSPREDLDRVALDFRQEDLDFSRVASGVHIRGWIPGLLNMRRNPVRGWYGESHARLDVAVEVERNAGKTVPAIFIPLFASLLIPLLALWLNKVEDGQFKIEAFELANIVIGGLFALIALNFTVGAEYPTLTSGDNTVTRLFGLNYVTLALSLVINLVLFRFNLVARWFGRHAQEALYRYLVWALPLFALATATSIVLVSMA